MEYWAKRILDEQNKITDKNIDATEAQLRKYYKQAMQQAIEEFENTYNALLAQTAAGQEPTVAKLYTMDKYYKMQAQIKQIAEELGDKEIALMSKQFEKQYEAIYNTIEAKTDGAFGLVNGTGADTAINTIWCSDGKHFSDRIWANTGELVETLNDSLVSAVITGKTQKQLKQELQKRFNVSYSNADCIARTEMARLQTQASLDRYKAHGRKQVRIIVDEDERTCPICAKKDDKLIDIVAARIGETIPPFHPRCRCCIAPVVEEAAENTTNKQSTKTPKVKRGQTEDNPYTSAALAKQKKEAIASGKELTYYGHTCESCGLYFETKKRFAKTCPVCKNKIHSYSGGKEKRITKCIKCGKGFITTLGQNINVCPDCQAEMLATKEATRLLKRGYTEKGTIKVMTGQTQSLTYINPKFDKNKANDTLFNTNRNDTLLDLFIEQNADVDIHEFDGLSKQEQNNKFFVCIDCGRVVYKGDNRNNNQKRCPECQAAYRRKYKAEKERERRKKNNN